MKRSGSWSCTWFTLIGFAAVMSGCASDPAAQACQACDVVLGDTLGEMPWYYACAQVAIVAGSFAPLGGQNFIEASALGCPVLVGPHVANFAQAVADALQSLDFAEVRDVRVGRFLVMQLDAPDGAAASERVREKYGFACSSAMDQLARIEAAAKRQVPGGRVTVESFES